MHSFSIASILGEDKPVKQETPKPKDEVVFRTEQGFGGSNSYLQGPLLTSTPLPRHVKDDFPNSVDISNHSNAEHYQATCDNREHFNGVTSTSEKDGHTRELLLPPPIENSTRVEKWVLENCVREKLSPESNRRDILAESFALAMGDGQTASEQSEIGEDKSASSGSHDRSFTSESCSRPGSPDLDRRPSKKARTSFSASQLCDLETKYKTQRYISAADRIKLARRLRLSDKQVMTWYQNRRMKEKRHVQDIEHARKFSAVAHGIAAIQNPSAFIFGHSKPPGSTPATVPVSTVGFPQHQPVPTPATTLPRPVSIDFLNQQMRLGQPQTMVTAPSSVMGSFTAMLSSQGPMLSPHAVSLPTSQTFPTVKEQSGALYHSPTESSFSPPSSLTHAYNPVALTSGQLPPAFTRMAPTAGLPSAFHPVMGYPSMHPLRA